MAKLFVSLKLIYFQWVYNLIDISSFLFLEEKCRGFHTLTPGSEKGKWIYSIFIFEWMSLDWSFETLHPVFFIFSSAMMWLSLSLEIMYVGLLFISCTLLSVQLCIRAWFPSTQRWGQLLNAFAAVFTVLGGTMILISLLIDINIK